MNLNEAIGVYKGLESLMKKELKAPMAFKVARAFRALEVEAKDFDQAQAGIFSKYGTQDEEKAEWTVSKENTGKVIQERDELLAVECAAQVPAFLEADFDGLEISPAVLAQLLPVIAQPA